MSKENEEKDEEAKSGGEKEKIPCQEKSKGKARRVANGQNKEKKQPGDTQQNPILIDSHASSTNHNEGKKNGAYGLPSRLDDEVAFPTDIKLERPDDCIPDDDKEFKICVVCGERASGYYFGALVCLPCKSFYIRCTKDGEPTFTCQCNGNCDIAKQGRIRCQYCRYQRCLMAGMCRKEKPETVQPQDGQVLCKVCGDIANGIHFGVNTCEGCKKFFRRGLVENQSYLCKSDKKCAINPRNRNNCRFCRYQKCIGVGMSREAIKMGRPKKADTADLGATANGTDHLSHDEGSSSPKPSSRPEKTPSPQGSHYSPNSSPPRQTGSPLFDLSRVKTEPEMCDLDNQAPNNVDSPIAQTSQSASSILGIHSNSQMYTPTPLTSYATARSNVNWTNSVSMTPQPQMACSQTNWHQQVAQSVAQQPMISSMPTSTNTNVTMTTSKNGVTDNSLIYEDDMDEILDYLSQDSTVSPIQQNTNQNSQCMMENPACPSFPIPSQKQFDQQIRDYHDQATLQSSRFNQLNVDTTTGPIPRDCATMYPQMSPQSHRYQNLSGSSSSQYNGHSPAEAPVYGPGSPSHESLYSPNKPQNAQYCNNQPLQSSMYNAGSPVQHSSSYSPQPSSPYNTSSNQMYHNPQFSQTSDSCQYNAGSPASHYSAGSPASHYNAGSPASHYSAGSPAAHYNASSPASHCSMSPPYQPPQQSYKPSGPHIDVAAQMKINQQFLNCENLGSFSENDSEMDGLTRHDMDATVVENSLKKNLAFLQYRCNAAYSPGSSPLSVHSGSDDSQDGLMEGNRLNRKRKLVEESCDYNGMTSNYSQCLYDQTAQKDFVCEKYSMLDTQNYWNRPLAYNGPTVPQEEAMAIINHVMSGYNHLRDICDESKTARNSLDIHWPNMGAETSHWHHIQRRTIRNIMNSMEFFKSLPGFDKIHPADMMYLTYISSFQVCLLINATDLFDEENGRFRYFWNFTVSPNNPTYYYKLHLVQHGQKVNKLKLSPVERALMAAIILFSADFRNLQDPDTLEDIRQKFIDILMTQIAAQGMDPVKRVQELFSIIPAMRHVTLWHKQLMKKMKANVDLQEVQQVFQELSMEIPEAQALVHPQQLSY